MTDIGKRSERRVSIPMGIGREKIPKIFQCHVTGPRCVKRLFPIVLVFFLAAGEVLPGCTTASGAQSGQTPRHGGSRGTREAAHERINRLVELEKSEPTTSRNVIDRHDILSDLLRSDPSIRRLVPKRDAREIQTLIQRGELSQAAAMVHDIILKLGSQGPDMGRGHAATTPSKPSFSYNINNIANNTSFGNILKLHHPAVDSVNRRLYVSGTKSFYLGVVDLDSHRLLETFDMGITGGFLLCDAKTGDLFLCDIRRRKFFHVQVGDRRVVEIAGLPGNVSMPPKDAPVAYEGLTYKDTGYPFRRGYLQHENAAYAVIEVRDGSGRIVDRLLHGPDAAFFDIDRQTGRLYAANTGDASVTMFDLRDGRRRIGNIDVGTSVDEVVIQPETGGLFIRNRLGGSTVFYLDPESGRLTTIPNENAAGRMGIGMWPTQIICDRGELFVLSHYGGRIDVIDAASKRIKNRIELRLSAKPRTDGISTMVMNRHRRFLYAAFPELGEIAVVDVNRLKHVETIKVRRFTRGGPARIVLEVDEKLNSLFVYIPDENRLYSYHGDTLVRGKTVTSQLGRTEGVLKANPDMGILYAGNKALDAETLEPRMTFDKGEMVVGFDNDAGSVYLKDFRRVGGGRKQERIYEYVGGGLTREWALSPVLSIPSSIAFDFDRKKFFAGYFETAVVEAFELE